MSSSTEAKELMYLNQKIDISNEIIELLKSKKVRTNLYLDNSAELSAGLAVELLEFTIFQIKKRANTQKITELF